MGDSHVRTTVTLCISEHYKDYSKFLNINMFILLHICMSASNALIYKW